MTLTPVEMLPQSATHDEAGNLIDTLQAFVVGEIDLTDAEAEAAMRRLDELLPDLPPVIVEYPHGA